MSQSIKHVTIIKRKAKSKNVKNLLAKMDECFKYYNCSVTISADECSRKDVEDYLSVFHELSDYYVSESCGERKTVSVAKSGNTPDTDIVLDYGSVETELPFVEEKKTEQLEQKFKITEDGCKVPSIQRSNDKTRQVMCKINEEMYTKDVWYELDKNGCCAVCVGGLDYSDDVDLKYVKDNISHSSVVHKCVNIDIKRTKDRAAVVVVLTWKR